MSSPEWRDTFPIKNAEREKNLKALEDAKKALKQQKLENLLP